MAERSMSFWIQRKEIIMWCPIRSALEWKCECPYGCKYCNRQFIEIGNYMYLFCANDVRNGEVFATRVNVQDSKTAFTILEVKRG